MLPLPSPRSFLPAVCAVLLCCLAFGCQSDCQTPAGPAKRRDRLGQDHSANLRADVALDFAIAAMLSEADPAAPSGPADTTQPTLFALSDRSHGFSAAQIPMLGETPRPSIECGPVPSSSVPSDPPAPTAPPAKTAPAKPTTPRKPAVPQATPQPPVQCPHGQCPQLVRPMRR